MKFNAKKVFKNNKIALFIIIIILILIVSLSVTKIVQYNQEKKKAEQIGEYKYIVHSVNANNEMSVTLTFANSNGIKEIIDFENNQINPNGKLTCAIDYKVQDFEQEKFTVTYSNGEKKDFNITFEVPRIKGDYILDDRIYVQKPNLSTGYNKTRTRYMYKDSNGNLVPGNWIDGAEPDNWFDYKSQNWANIYVENEGLDSYYVWIPRYCYKVDQDSLQTSNQRTDIKFINVYNEYKDEAGNTTTWDELKAQGYKYQKHLIGKIMMDNLHI